MIWFIFKFVLNLEIEKRDLYLKNIPFLIFSPTPDLAQPSSPFPFPASACFPAAQPRFPFLLPGLLRGPVSLAHLFFLLPASAQHRNQLSRFSPPSRFPGLLRTARSALRPALRSRSACSAQRPVARACLRFASPRGPAPQPFTACLSPPA